MSKEIHKLSSNRQAIAEEMLPLLLKSLSEEFLQIKQAHLNNDHDLLLSRLHKLHGAVSYCNVPQLKGAISALETALKRKQISESLRLFVELEKTVTQLIQSDSGL